MEITETTDLAQLIGVRVRVRRPNQGINSESIPITTHVGVFESLRHGVDSSIPSFDRGLWAGGIFCEEPTDGRRGSNGGFHLPYGSTVTVL